MTLSYIITTFNRPALLEQAVAFVAAERFVDSELILVDDSSQPAAEMPALAEKVFPGACRLIRNKRNLGVIGARNAGIAAAKGEFILFLDDDDESLPNRSRDLLKDIETSDFDFVAARSFMGKGQEENLTPPSGGFELSPLTLLTNPPHIDAVIWRRESLLASNGLDNRIPYLGEHVTMVLWLLKGRKGLLSDAVVARFGYREEGLTLAAQENGSLRQHLLDFYTTLLWQSPDPKFRSFCSQVRGMLEQHAIPTFDDYLQRLRNLVKALGQ